MAAHDAAATISRSLASFLAPARDDLEIIVVDDGSRDGTVSLLADLPGAERIRIIRLETAIGQTAALNIGLREARGDLIVRQDADDWSHPDRLDAQGREFAKPGRLDFLGTGHTVILADGTRLAVPGRNFGDLGKRLSEGTVFCHGSLMMRRESLLGIGGYDSFYRYAQDADLILRAHRAGLILRNLEACLYDWYDSPDGITATHYPEQAAYEELALESGARSDIDRSSAFAEILARHRAFPYSARFRKMQLCLAAGETALARRELIALRKAGEKIPRAFRYAMLTALPRPAYLAMRRWRDGG